MPGPLAPSGSLRGAMLAGLTGARRCLARRAVAARPWLCPSAARSFAVYRTPASASDASKAPVVEHQVQVSPTISRLKPAFDALRRDRQIELTKKQVMELCPRVLPEVVDGLFSTFDKHGGNGQITYDEMCAFVLLACEGTGAEEKVEALFPISDVDGDNMISRQELTRALRILYYARFRDQEYVAFKVDKIVDEAMATVEGDSFDLMQFTAWSRSDGPLMRELRDLLQKGFLDPHLATLDKKDAGLRETWPVQAKLSFDRIKVDNPIVELDGDEMTRIMWQMIKEKLIFPFLDMDIDYYDLSITFRDETDDQVTVDAAKAILRHNVGIKCPTIVPDEARVLEFNLQQMWKSPNKTLRNMLDGTVFCAPITINNIPRYVTGWEKPIIIGRHAFGDRYKASEVSCDTAGTFKVVFDPDDGEATEVVVHTFKASSNGGVMMGMYNTRESVENFAKSCFEHALDQGFPLYLSTKSSVLKEYDGLFVETFNHMYQATYRKQFEDRGLWYQHRLTDDMVAQVMKSKGGYVWACKNDDGDILSGLVAQGYGSPGLMTSTLVCPDGMAVLTEAGHGTITKHYRSFQKGAQTSTNPIACIFSWSRGLAHRAKLDGNDRLAHFGNALEEACVTCVQRGLMSKDLAMCVHGSKVTPERWMVTEELLNAFANELRIVLSKPLKPTEMAQDVPFDEKADDDGTANAAGGETR